MVMPLACNRCGTSKVDLFKVKDDLWTAMGLAPTEIACIDCVEAGLNRPMQTSDLDPSFPWWNAQRPIYYQAIIDGVRKSTTRPAELSGEYQIGFQLGARLAVNSTPMQIDEFLGCVTVPAT